MANNFPPRGAKRRIEKSFSRIAHACGVVPSETIIHTADDRETLVRTIIKVTATHRFVAMEAVNLQVSVFPRAQSILNPSIVEDLDVPAPLQLIWTETKASDQDDETLEFSADMSGMRKLMKGDQIVFQDVTVQAAGYELHGVITLFFKE